MKSSQKVLDSKDDYDDSTTITIITIIYLSISYIFWIEKKENQFSSSIWSRILLTPFSNTKITLLSPNLT